MQAALHAAVSIGIPGIAAAVVTDHGSWQGAAGVDGLGQALTPEAEMGVGSVSKTFTAAEVLLLAARGRIVLDHPMSDYLHSPLVANHATVRDELGMLAGLSDGHYNLRTQQSSAHTPNSQVTLEQAISSDTETPSRPGVNQSYSNVSFLLLARLVEVVTHQRFAAAVHADLLRPNHLTRVAVQDTDKPQPPLAYPVDPSGNRPATDGYLPDRYTASAALGAGSVAANAHDEAQWGYDLYTGQVLPAALTAMMTTPQHNGSFAYGLGTTIFDPNQLGFSTLAVGHTGEIYHRNDGGIDGYGSILLVVPSKHISVAVTVDEVGKDYLPTALTLLRAATS